MAKSTLGNTAQPICFLTEYEVEVDDDEYENMDGELVDEQDVFGYRATCPKNSDSTTVTIYFYYHAPTSSWYWDYTYGLAYYPIIPVVFSVDSNWNLTECLNQSFTEITLSNRNDGWISMNVILKRKLVKNERIVFGVYSDILGVSSSHDEWNHPEETQCYYYWSNARRNNYNTAIAYVSSLEFIQKANCGFSDWEVCLYLQYENEVESVAYTRTVLGNVGATTANTRKLHWKRTFLSTWNINSTNARKAIRKITIKNTETVSSLFTAKENCKRVIIETEEPSASCTRKTVWKRILLAAGNISDSLIRQLIWKRNASSSENISSDISRFNRMSRLMNEKKQISASYDRRIFFFRRHVDQEEITARSSRSNIMKFETSDRFSFTDSMQQLLLIIRSVFSTGSTLDSSNHVADYKKKPESVVDDEELIIRSGDNYRSFTEEIEFEALPFASRLFFRTVQTVMSFWDWLRGKIREANNVKSFYCPIWTEIEVECRI